MGAPARLPGASARHRERTRAQLVWSVRVGPRCDGHRAEASNTPKHPSSGPGRALGRRCSAGAWPLVRQTSRRRPRGGAPGAADPRRVAVGRWQRPLFSASLMPVPTAVHLRRPSGRRRWRVRRLLRVSAWESVVVLARAPERLSVPVRPWLLHTGGRLQCVTVAGRRRGSGGCSCVRGNRMGVPHDPAPSAAVYAVRVGRCDSPPQHDLNRPHSGDLRVRSGFTDWLRSGLFNGGREIRGNASGSPADHCQQRRRPAVDRAGEQEDRQR